MSDLIGEDDVRAEVGHLSGDRSDLAALHTSFPLFHRGEYDFFFERFPDIGLKSTHSESLKKKVAAALISETLGLKSVDNVLRTYGRDFKYPVTSEKRLDLVIRGFLDRSLDHFGYFLADISNNENAKFGEVLSNWTLFRVRFSMQIYANNAQLGALFEALAIARMSLEQIAWSYRVRNESEERIPTIKAQACMSFLKSACPYAGRLYGWLSEHAHWEFGGHMKSMVSKRGHIGHMHASSYFKALLFAVMLVFCHVIMAVAMKIVELEKPGKTSWLKEAATIQRRAKTLLQRVQRCAPDDPDLAGVLALVA